MSLKWKLFFSYMIVVLVGLLILSLATAFIAPVTFVDFMSHMHMGGSRGMMGRMDGRMLPDLQAAIEASYRESLNNALLATGIVATLTAVIVSWFISRRVVGPIRETVRASQHIAAGSYDERLLVQSDDELGDLAESFNRMAAALAETEAMRQQLIADVSHELKTPLASIKGYMEGLQDGVVLPTSETFQRIYREADRLQKLVQDLQELSHAESAQMEMHFQSCDATALITSAVEWLRPQFEDKSIALVIEPSEALLVQADFDRIRQVLLNLLGNALQYTPDGGRVSVQVSRNGDRACFAVKDTGVGLCADDLERVFQRFYRVDKSRARASGGSGIGLTIARYIVQMHGGRVWAKSDGLGKGSAFFFSLPLTE